MNHTPTPWTLHQNTEEGIHILSANDVIVCEHIADGETAQAMLRACNSHQALVEALKGLLEFYPALWDGERDILGNRHNAATDALDAAESALSLATA